MQLTKLFNVLVVGGAALVGCVVDEPESSPNDQDDSSATDPRKGSSGSAAAGGDGSGSGSAAGGASAAGGGDASGGGSATGSGGGAPLECSSPASPSDPCGCACCWADCPNTDEVCCGGFCEAGNDGAGCCGL